MKTRRDFRVAENERGFDQPGDACGSIEVTDVCLHRADGAEVPIVSAGAECLRESGDFYGIAERCACPVSFNVADSARFDSRECVCERDDLRVSIHARRGEAHFAAAVVVESGGFDHSVDLIAVVHGIREPFQNYDTHATAEHSASGTLIESAAVAVGRSDAALAELVAAFLRKSDRDAACECGVAREIQQALHGLAHGDERCAASGVDI